MEAIELKLLHTSGLRGDVGEHRRPGWDCASGPCRPYDPYDSYPLWPSVTEYYGERWERGARSPSDGADRPVSLWQIGTSRGSHHWQLAESLQGRSASLAELYVQTLERSWR
jgi:hypothetical protein